MLIEWKREETQFETKKASIQTLLHVGGGGLNKLRIFFKNLTRLGFENKKIMIEKLSYFFICVRDWKKLFLVSQVRLLKKSI